MKQLITYSLILAAISLTGGCQSARPKEMFGKTYFLDGAGNLGLGGEEVKRGLHEAGYKGDVEIFTWTTSFNPLLDQWNILAAKWQAAKLSRKIEDYHRRFPNNQINIVALSAGTGVATWAIEKLGPQTNVENIFLLGSSLSHDYNMNQALHHIDGRVYVYHSPHDLVLASVRVIGTIDGRRGVESAGLVGLVASADTDHKIINTPWSRSWKKLGWHGGHGDCANRDFAREEIGRHILTGSYAMLRLVRGHEEEPPLQLASFPAP